MVNIQAELFNRQTTIDCLFEANAILKHHIGKMRNCYNCNNWITCMQRNPFNIERCTKNDYSEWELKDGE